MVGRDSDLIRDPFRVLLRSDDPDRRSVLAESLRSLGAEVETTDLAGSAPPDTGGSPLFHVMLPGSGPCPLVAALRAGTPSRTWVLLPSGRAGEEVALLAEGAREVLPDTTAAEALVLRLQREASRVIHEKELQFREDVLQVVIDALPGCVGYIDTSERIVFNNRMYETWFGIPWRDVPGMTVREILGEKNYGLMQAKIRTTIDKGETTSFQDVVLLHDGTTRIVDGKRVPHRDADGVIRGYAIVTWDRTPDWSLQEATWFRKIIEETSDKVGQDFFSTLVHQMAEILRFDCVVAGEWVDPRGDELHLLGISTDRPHEPRARTLGAPWTTVKRGDSVIHPSGASRAFPEGLPWICENAEVFLAVPLKDRAGTVTGLIALVHSQPVVDLARTRSMLEIFALRAETELERQRTEQLLRASETKYRELFRVIPDAILLADLDQFRVLESNPAAQQLFGYDDEELRSLHGLDLSAEPEGSLRSVDAMRRGEDVQVPLRWMRRKGGEIFPAEATGSTMVLEGRRLNISVLRDISSRLETEAQLRALSVRREHDRETERTRISRAIHDEFGQKLTALKIDLSMLEKRLAGSTGESIERLRVMKDLVNNLLADVRRISTELRPPILDDMGLVAAIEWQLEELQGRTGVKTSLVVEPERVVVGWRIATTLFRILQEALTNVLRHSGAKRVSVELRVARGRVTLVIEDDGRGIDAKVVKESSSLGLMGMRERVAEHEGRFEIRGGEESGTRITVDLPMSPDSEAE